MTGKADVPLSSAYRLLHPMHTVLVTSVGKAGLPNIITLAWTMPTSQAPPLAAISVSPKRHSHKLIEETREFVINIPTFDVLRQVSECGSTSGRTHNKFAETNLAALPARKTKAPIIQECIAHLECKLQSQLTTGDHTIFIGEIIEAYANEGVFTDRYNLEKARMIFHLGGNKFVSLEPRLHSF